MAFGMRNSRHDNKGVSLVIVVFAMMLFAVLGWTLAAMLSSDFEANLRNLDSERALGVAEAGGQWAIKRLQQSYACSSVTGASFPHTFGFGQYSCTCDDTVADQITIHVTGYVPLQSNYRAMRKISVIAVQSAFQRLATIKNLLTWYNIHANSSLVGDLAAGHYDGDNISPFDVGGADYGTNLPPGTGTRELTSEVMPTVNMAALKAKAQGYNKYKDYTNTDTISNSAGSPRDYILKASSNFFDNSIEGDAVRIIGDVTYQWPNENSWVIITKYNDRKEVEVQLKPAAGLTSMSQWRDKTMRVVKRFNGNVNNDRLWYVKGSDVVIDVRNTAQDGDNNACNMNHTSAVAEGDILISGSKGLIMKAYVDSSAHETFPNLATQNGNIYSTFTPEGSTEQQKANNRDFDGLIYTQAGNISLNYIKGTAVMGYNVTLDGFCDLSYTAKFIDSDAFTSTISKIIWKEE